ncbi:gephyrin-like molybdotransferase Glp [Rufibacter sediminis]|uniref:Molybdopterin molybdenumtransferase n=1 Tax=Rufibacter sediminis TaxID=2762756 RepID=A0ABR6VWN0_9BACT|nr:gephyrin-like molybdotransferase Glp [Rufibacter sediminis]MBC3541608.1 molybdopterin molybdotransferase MoeA [Rufibacter sediminis]
MISVAQALQLVLQHKISPQTEEVELLQSLGRTLAQDVTADRDFPPFHRVTMDGIAVRASDFVAGIRAFPIEEIHAAGSPQKTLHHPGHCLEVMTGAVLPQGTDAVVPYEECTMHENVATVLAEKVRAGQNIHPQGSDKKAGEVLLTSGVKITPAILGTLASVGYAQVPVFQLPSVAICSTGDELVEVQQQPLPHQIRRSNAYMLAGALQQENIQASLFHLPDEPAIMQKRLAKILEAHDVLLLSGGVSKGKFDFLPQVLEELGFTPVFHKIAQKPGKPMLFGTLPEQKVVFGLPGNPVSTFVCYQLFFRPWLHASLHQDHQPASAQLTQTLTFKPALTYHVPVKLHQDQGILKATPIPTTGSGDLTSILEADGLLSLPPEQENFAAGEAFPLTLFT